MENNKKIWIGVIIVLVVLAGVFLYLRSRSNQMDTDANILPEVKNSLTVSDQDPDTIAIIVDSVGCTINCFVVIHADDNGVPGAVVASSALLGPRMHRNVSIVTNTTRGATYHAMLHGDDGNGNFNAALDAPLKDEAGNIVTARFMVRETRLIDGELDIKG